MLAYGDARVSQRRHNRHRHRHHRRQSRGRRRGRPGGGQDTNSAPAAGACPRPSGARRRRGVAARPVGGAGRTGPARRQSRGRLRDGAVADRRRRRRQAADAGPAVRRQPGQGDQRARDTTFLAGEAVEFLRWTAREAPDAAGYWPAPAVANYALAGEAVIDNASASTTYPLFDGTGWSEDRCAECGATADRMPQGRADRRRGRPTARCRCRAGRRLGRRAVRAACRRRRPRRRRASCSAARR